jgi:hypothetical protein
MTKTSLDLSVYEDAVAWVENNMRRILPISAEYRSYYAKDMGEKAVYSRPDELISQSERGAGSHLALRYGIACRLRRGEELPQNLLTWLIDYLEGNRPIPARREGAPTRWEVQIHLAEFIRNLVDQGWRPTRNDDPSPRADPISACDIVAEAMKRVGAKPSSYSGVKRAWIEIRNGKAGDRNRNDMDIYLGVSGQDSI